MSDGESVSSGTEVYELSEIEPGIVQFTWRQQIANRTEYVVATLNLYKWSVYGVKISSNEARYSAGSFAVEDGLDASQTSARCT